MTPTEQETATLEAAYRRALFKVLGHLVFVVVCCAAAFVLRRMFGLPPAFLSIVFLVALVLFGGDIFRFLRLRYRVQRRRLDHPS